MDSISMKARVTGKVQGVGYRAWLRDEAQARDLKGFVRNEDDGSVTVVLSGAPADVEAIASELRAGPEGTKVDDVETESVDTPEGDGFSIRG